MPIPRNRGELDHRVRMTGLPAESFDSTRILHGSRRWDATRGQRTGRSEVQLETRVIIFCPCVGVLRFIRKRWPSGETSYWVTTPALRISSGIRKREPGVRLSNVPP